MADRKVLLNEIALLTNLLGNETSGAEGVKRVSPFIHTKRKLIVRPINKFRYKRGPDLRPFAPVEILSFSNAVSGSQAPFQPAEPGEIKQVNDHLGFTTAAHVLKSQTSMNRSISAYKVDRRVRKSSLRSVTGSSPSTYYVRKNSATKLASLLSLSPYKKSCKRNVVSSPTSSFRKYSVRKYSIRKIKPSGSSVSGNATEPVPCKINGKVLTSYFTPSNNTKGSHQVVRIEGANYLSRNAGKSLKRISFSLPDLSNFQCLSKPKTPGHRSANRVLQRSITTLGGGGNKKRRVCYFLSNFGRCKRKENSICPFFHGLPDMKTIPTKLVKCKYFRKGQCTRPKCHYIHEKDPISRHRQLHWNRRVKSSIGRKIRKKLSMEDDPKNPMARYYLAEPDANPLNTVITRRLPKGVEVDADAGNPSSPNPSTCSRSSSPVTSESDPEIEIIFDSNCDKSNEGFGPDQMVSTKSLFCIDRDSPTKTTTSTPTPTPTEDRRHRLLSKVTSLKDRLGKGKEMPIYLPFIRPEPKTPD